MIRTFKQHHLRLTSLLDGQWEFVTDPQRVGHQQEWAVSFPPNHQTLYVPSCWNNELNMYDYEGVAWYRTHFTIHTTKHIRLIFHGVLGATEIYVDGKLVGSHYGGFSAFEVVLPELMAGTHSLVVRADNLHTHQTIPLERVDWFHYGGIIRSVELQELPDVFIDKVRIQYKLNHSLKKSEVELTCSLRSLSHINATIPLTLSCNHVQFHVTEALVPAFGVTELTMHGQLDSVELWEVGNPHLYYFQLSTTDDDWIDRIGFRNVGVIGSDIAVNGNPIFLQGVNRHEEHPEWGFAFPPKLMKKDLDIILDMGCNSIRGSHYPNSRYWLDLLDEAGVAFWSEIPLWQFGPTHMADPIVQQRASLMLREMVTECYHHPSILFWSMNNECATETEEGFNFNKMLVEQVRSLDDSRLVTFATDRALSDVTLSLFDVIGINRYFGWYGGEVGEFELFLQQYEEYAKQMGSYGKPVIMAEFGGAGIFGDIGWEENRMFSEDYQALLLESALNIFKKDQQISGTYIWQFADIRSDVPRFRDRARGFNNKGLVNEYRKPKLAYRSVKKIYLDWKHK